MTSFVFDCVCLGLFTLCVVAFSIIYDSPLLGWLAETSCYYVERKCICGDEDYGKYYDRCQRDLTFQNSRTALFCMWAFCFLFTIIHLVLVARVSFTLKTVSPGQVLNAPGQNVIPMQTMAPQGPAQVYVPPPGAYPRQPLPSIHQHQPTSVQGPPQVDVPKTSPAAEQSQDISLQAAVQVGDAQPQSSSKSAAPPV